MPRFNFYERRIFPWLNDKLTSGEAFMKIRAEALSTATGRIVEIGFGSGANLLHYPPTVREIVALEPNEGMLERARPRREASRAPLQIVIGNAEHLPFAAGSFDTAVSTLTLCSVSDPDAALAELHRVLRDDGRLIVLEHGLSKDASVARWQRRLNPFQQVLAAGCHLDRPISELLARHGFYTDAVRQFYAPDIPRTHGWISVGAASKKERRSAGA